MKIVHYPGSFLPQIGGAEIIVHNLATVQVERGNSVFIIAPNLKKAHLEGIGSINYKIIRPIKFSFSLAQKFSKHNKIFDWIIQKQIQEFQLKYQFDIWHFNLLGPNNLKAVEVLSKMKVPTVGTFRGSDIQCYPKVNYGQRRDTYYNNLLKKNIHYFDSLTAISDSIVQEYLSLGIEKSKIKKIPNFIDLSRYRLKSINKNVIREKYGIPSKDKIILTVGRNHKKKGYSLIPDIILTLKNNGESFKWVIIGKDCEDIKEKAQILNVYHHLIFIDEVGVKRDDFKEFNRLPSKEIIEIYFSSDVFCFPTVVESFGNVFLEAMATGIPIITTDAPGARDLIKNNFNGFVSRVDDIKGLSHNIIKAFKSKNKIKNIIHNGRQEVKKYDINTIAPLYQDHYAGIISKK